MFRPLLAPHESPKTKDDFFESLKFPLYGSPKLDGIRCLPKTDRKIIYTSDFQEKYGPSYFTCKSREFLDLPSKQVQALFSNYQDLDGELIAGDETETDLVYNRTQSHVMSEDKPSDDLKFRVFDSTDVNLLDTPYIERLANAEEVVAKYNQQFGANVSMIKQVLCEDITELLELEDEYLTAGYEGVMLRDPFGRYKNGRGTFKEGIIYKLKRSEDDEGIIVGFIEGNTNKNKLEVDALGYAKRSSAKAGKIAANTLGKFIILYKGIEQSVAPGYFKKDEKDFIWANQEMFLGKILKFRYFGKGIKDRPRHPRALGFRDKSDMDIKKYLELITQMRNRK